MKPSQKAISPPRLSRSVVDWRRGRLLAAGFAPDVATELARDEGVDLHAVFGLIDRGCEPELAVRILAPLEDPCWPW